MMMDGAVRLTIIIDGVVLSEVEVYL